MARTYTCDRCKTSSEYGEFVKSLSLRVARGGHQQEWWITSPVDLCSRCKSALDDLTAQAEAKFYAEIEGK